MGAGREEPSTQDPGPRTQDSIALSTHHSSLVADVERALATGMGPWLYHELASGGGLERLGPEHRFRLHQSYLASTSRNLLILRELEELAPLLPGVRMLLLKGLALLPLYPEIGLRPLSDADVLIAPHDLPAVRRRLAELGYRPEPVHAEAYDVEYYREMSFARPFQEGVFRLDLHWGLVSAEWLPEQGTPDFEELWARSLPGPVDEERLRIPCLEDNLLHLCLHAALHHSFAGSLPYLDAALLLGHEAPFRWDLFLKLARRSGWRPAVYWTLERTRALAGARAPKEVMLALRPGGTRRRLIGLLAGSVDRPDDERLVGHQASRLLQLALADGPGNALAMVGSALFPSEKWLRLRYGAGPERPSWILRLFHSWRLMGLMGRGLGQVLPRPALREQLLRGR